MSIDEATPLPQRRVLEQRLEAAIARNFTAAAIVGTAGRSVASIADRALAAGDTSDRELLADIEVALRQARAELVDVAGDALDCTTLLDSGLTEPTLMEVRS